MPPAPIIETLANTRYVSNNGNDSWAGTSNKPYATITAAMTALPTGGFIYLERASTWTGFTLTVDSLSFGAFNEGADPLIDTSGGDGITFSGYVQDVNIADIRFEGANTGLRIDNAQTILVEDCTFVGAGIDISIGGTGDPLQPLENITIRNCVVRDCQDTGIYVSECQTLTIDQCAVYNNGLASTTLNHNIECASAGSAEGGGNDLGMDSATISNCMIGKAGGDYGIKFLTQTNGTIENCTFAQNRRGLLLATEWEEDVAVGNTVRDNTFLASGNSDAVTTTTGIEISGQQQCVIDNNRFVETEFGDTIQAACLSFRDPLAFQADVGGYCAAHTAPTLRDIQLINNRVYAWPGVVLHFAASTCPPDVLLYQRVNVEDNVFQQRTHNSGVPDPVVRYEEGASSNITYENNVIWGADADPSDWIVYT